MGTSEEFGDILKLLVFIAEKPRINFPLVLGSDAVTVQPRVASRSTKDVSKIPGPLPVGKGVWGCRVVGNRFVSLVPDLRRTS